MSIYLSKLWKEPDYGLLNRQGQPRTLLYWKHAIYNSMPVAPQVPDAEEDYRKFVNDVKEKVERTTSIVDAFDMKDYLLEVKFIVPVGFHHYFLTKRGYDVGGRANLDLFKISNNLQSLQAQVKQHQFLYSDNEKVLADYEFVDLTDKANKLFEVDGRDELKELASSGNHRYLLDSCGYKGENTLVIIENHIVEACDSSIEEKKKEILSGFKVKIKAVEEAEAVEIEKYGRAYLRNLPVNELAEQYKADQKTCCIDAALIYSETPDFSGFGFNEDDIRYADDDVPVEVAGRAYNALYDLCDALSINTSTLAQSGNLTLYFGGTSDDENDISVSSKIGDEHIASQWLLHVLKANDYDLAEIARSLKYEGNDKETRFYKNALRCDKWYKNSDEISFTDDSELIGRAFERYIKKICENRNIRNISLYGTETKAGHLMYPTGDELEHVTSYFDRLLDEMAEDMVLDRVPLPVLPPVVENEIPLAETLFGAYDFKGNKDIAEKTEAAKNVPAVEEPVKKEPVQPKAVEPEQEQPGETGPEIR